MICKFTINAHSNSVSKVLWSGNNLIYTAGHDRLIKIWDSNNGRLIR